jgi:hypothetical protein
MNRGEAMDRGVAMTPKGLPRAATMPRALRRRALTWWAAGVVVAGALCGACTSPRNALGTNASPCYQALPVAAAAVHHRGTLQGVRLVDVERLPENDRLRAVLSKGGGSTIKTVCAFSYRGSYRLDQVQRPLGRQPTGGSAPYAVVLVSMPHNALLATFVLAHQPFRFRHNVV